MSELNVDELKKNFPFFEKYPDVCYLDSAASSLVPLSVIEMMNEYYKYFSCNIHRGNYQLSFEATQLYEEARSRIARFINADDEEIIFTSGTSQSLNIVAESYVGKNIHAGDEILTSELEHHSSFIPFLNVSKKKSAKLNFIPLTVDGEITVENFKRCISEKIKFIELTFVSNVLGHITPLREIIKICHERDIVVSVDAAQAIAHMKVDVKDLDCDFLSFSGHKMCGPFGVGVLFCKKKILQTMDPITFGGGMVDVVNKDSCSYKDGPRKFEVGTPPIAEVLGLSRACDFLENIGLKKIFRHENILKQKCMEKLRGNRNVEIYNPYSHSGIFTFNIKGVHPHDAAMIYDRNKVCLRTGHHCAQMITKFLNQHATTRSSFYLYNDLNDVEKLVNSIEEAQSFFYSEL